MATIPQEFIAKAGWVHRQSEVLKRWKQQWCVLYGDGGLAFYTNESRREREVVIRMPIDALYISSGLAVHSVAPPEYRGHDSLIEIKMHYQSSVVMCAESPDDCKAWTMALEQMKVVQPPQPQVYSTQPANVTVIRHVRAPPRQTYRSTTVTTTTYPDGRSVVTPGATQTVIYPNTQTTQVVRTGPGQAVYIDPYQYQYGQPYDQNTIIVDGTRRHGTSDFATGAMVGAAAGVMLMGPWMWGPMLW